MAINPGKKIKRRLTDLGTVVQSIYADIASVIRMAESGLDLLPVGSITTQVRVNQNTPVMVYNSTGAVLFAAFGDDGMAVPTGATDGIPIPANSTVVLNSGEKIWIRASAAGLFAYTGDN